MAEVVDVEERLESLVIVIAIAIVTDVSTRSSLHPRPYSTRDLGSPSKARIVDEQVQRQARGDEPVRELVDAVDRRELDLPALGLGRVRWRLLGDLVQHRLRLGGRAAREDNVDTVACELERSHLADTRAGTGDQGDLALERAIRRRGEFIAVAAVRGRGHRFRRGRGGGNAVESRFGAKSTFFRTR